MEVADLSLSPAANEAPETARVQPSATAAAMQIFMSMVVPPIFGNRAIVTVRAWQGEPGRACLNPALFRAGFLWVVNRAGSGPVSYGYQTAPISRSHDGL